MIDFKKIKLIQAIIFLCTIAGLALQFLQNLKVEKDNRRLKQTLFSIHSDVKQVRLKEGVYAYETKVLKLKLDELKTLYPESIGKAKQLGIKARHIENITTHFIKDSLIFHTHVRDSVILDTLHIRYFNYSDDFYTIKSIERNDTAFLHIENRDTLFQVVHLGKRIKPWLLFFSKRELVQTVQVANPRSKLIYSKTIQIQKP